MAHPSLPPTPAPPYGHPSLPPTPTPYATAYPPPPPYSPTHYIYNSGGI